MRFDITLEFYYNTATYQSPITGALQKIQIKDVYIELDKIINDDGSIKFVSKTMVLSRRGNLYDVNDLIFEFD